MALGDDPESAWRLPDAAEVLLINQDSAKLGFTKPMRAPEGWPFNLKWVHLRSTGIDKYPDWIFVVPQVSVTRGWAAPRLTSPTPSRPHRITGSMPIPRCALLPISRAARRIRSRR